MNRRRRKQFSKEVQDVLELLVSKKPVQIQILKSGFQRKETSYEKSKRGRTELK